MDVDSAEQSLDKPNSSFSVATRMKNKYSLPPPVIVE